MQTRPTSKQRRSVGGMLALLVAVVALPFAGATAEPFLTEVEWIHPHPDQLRGFAVLFALDPAERAHPKSIDVGKPAVADRFVWSISVPEQTSVWVAVVAVGPSGAQSPPSAWRRVDWRPGQGPLASPDRPYLVRETER
jgi:hypothetical protein